MYIFDDGYYFRYSFIFIKRIHRLVGIFDYYGLFYYKYKNIINLIKKS